MNGTKLGKLSVPNQAKGTRAPVPLVGVDLTDGTKVLDLPAAIANPVSPSISNTVFREAHNIAISPDGSYAVLERLHAVNTGGSPQPEVPVVEILDLTDPFNPVSLYVAVPPFVGYHEVPWDGCSDRGETVGSGVYFYRMTAPGLDTAKRMVMVR